jgi:hypothetical protein
MFGSGQAEICRRARIPAPVARINAAERAVSSRAEQNPTPKSPRDALAKTNVSTDDELAKLTQEAESIQHELTLEENESGLERQRDDARRRLNGLRTEKDAKRAVKNGGFYVECMNAYLSENPVVKEQFWSLVTQLHPGISADGIKSLQHNLLTQQHAITKKAIEVFPRVTATYGHPGTAYPINSNFFVDQWDCVLDGLRDELKVEEYNKQCVTSLPGPCRYDGTPLVHRAGGVFACQMGHQLTCNCRRCGSAMIFVGTYLMCYNCLIN